MLARAFPSILPILTTEEALEATRVLRARDGISLPSTIGRERQINPFLRCREPAVRAAAEVRAGHSLAEPVEIFAAVRSWKDGFQ